MKMLHKSYLFQSLSYSHFSTKGIIAQEDFIEFFVKIWINPWIEEGHESLLFTFCFNRQRRKGGGG